MAEPVSLELAKQQLRLEADFADEDELISGIIADARAWVENYTGQTLLAGEVVEWIDGFSDRLLTWPITSITAVAYRDRDNMEQAVPAPVYRPAIARRPGRLSLVTGSWPTLSTGPGVVKITMQAGYADGAVPRGMIRAMLLLITGYYDRRDTGGLSDDVERAARAACGPASRGWRV